VSDSFTTQPPCPRGKNSRYPLDRRLGGPQSRSGRDGLEKNAVGTGKEQNVWQLITRYTSDSNTWKGPYLLLYSWAPPPYKWHAHFLTHPTRFNTDTSMQHWMLHSPCSWQCQHQNKHAPHTSTGTVRAPGIPDTCFEKKKKKQKNELVLQNAGGGGDSQQNALYHKLPAWLPSGVKTVPEYVFQPFLQLHMIILSFEGANPSWFIPRLHNGQTKTKWPEMNQEQLTCQAIIHGTERGSTRAPRGTVLLVKLIVVQLVMKLPPFMEPKCPLPCSQKPACGPYSQQDASVHTFPP
jgi:hypothetical protein